LALELRDILYFFMGIIAICLAISFGAYQLTTYDSVRGIVGDIAQQPTQVVNLHTQYGNMVDQFDNSLGDSFTYHWGSQSIEVTASQVNGMSEQQCLSLVIDEYSTNLYNGHVTGDLNTASSLAGAGANGIYFITAILAFAVFIIILILSFIQQWYETTKDTLKSAGKIILVASVLAFIILLLAPPIIESVMWGSINSSDWAREVNNVVEPRIATTFLVNTLIMVLFGALLFGVGLVFHINTTEGDVDVGEYIRSSPKMTSKSAPKLKTDGERDQGKPGHRQL